MEMGAQPKDVADTRRVLTGKEAEGAETIKVRLVGKGLPGAGSAQWQCGYCGVCEPQVITFAMDISGGTEEVAELEPGYQEGRSP